MFMMNVVPRTTLHQVGPKLKKKPRLASKVTRGTSEKSALSNSHPACKVKLEKRSMKPKQAALFAFRRRVYIKN